LTIANLGCGIATIVCSYKQLLLYAVILNYWSMLFDLLDGDFYLLAKGLDPYKMRLKEIMEKSLAESAGAPEEEVVITAFVEEVVEAKLNLKAFEFPPLFLQLILAPDPQHMDEAMGAAEREGAKQLSEDAEGKGDDNPLHKLVTILPPDKVKPFSTEFQLRDAQK